MAEVEEANTSNRLDTDSTAYRLQTAERERERAVLESTSCLRAMSTARRKRPRKTAPRMGERTSATIKIRLRPKSSSSIAVRMCV